MHRKSKHKFCVPQRFPENCAFCEKMWKNFLEPDKPHMTIWLMRTACWVTKARDTLRISKSYYFSTATTVTPQCCLIYVHFLPFFTKSMLGQARNCGWISEGTDLYLFQTASIPTLGPIRPPIQSVQRPLWRPETFSQPLNCIQYTDEEWAQMRLHGIVLTLGMRKNVSRHRFVFGQ